MAGVVSLIVIMAVASRRMDGEEFGLFAILLVLMNFAVTLDGGLRFGLGNRLAALSSQPESMVDSKQVFWSVFHMECLIGGLGALACIGIMPWINWAGLFNIHSATLATESRWVFPAVCAMLMLNQPLTLAGTALFANHHIVIASVFGAVQSLLLMVAFWIGTFLPSFRSNCLVFFGVYLLCGVGLTVFFVFWKRWFWEWVTWRQQWAMIRSLAGPSLEFFWLSMASMASSLLGPFLAGAVGGLNMAGDFALIQRLFNLLVTVHMALLSPLSPTYTRHATRGEWERISEKLGVCVRQVWPIIFLGGGLLLIVLHPWILRIWAGRGISDYWLVVLLAVSAMIIGWANTYSVVLNSLGIVRHQAVLSVSMLVPVVGLPILLGQYFGIHGIAAAAVLCALPGAVLTMRWVHGALQQRLVNV